MRKKSLIAVSLMAALALAGCGGKATPASLMKAANESTAKAKSADMTVAMDLAANISASGMSMDLGMTMNMDMDITTDPVMMHATGNFSMDMLGQNESADIEMYMEQDGDKSVTYSKMGDEDWSKEEGESLENIMSMYALSDAETVTKNMEMAEDTETVNNIECYKLTGSVAGTDIESLMGSAMGSMDEMNMLGEMNMDDMTVPVEYFISKDKSQPVKMTIDLKDIMKESLGAAMAESTGAEGVETEVSSCAIEITFNSFDNVEPITIPDEVKQ